MKLSTAYLYEELKKKFIIRDFAGISGDDGFMRPFFYDAAYAEKEGHVAVLDGTQIKGKALVTDTFWVICGGFQGSGTLPEHYVWIELGGNENTLGIFNYIQCIFERCSQWQEEMNILCRNGGSIEELLKISAKFIGNPMMVMGLDFSLDGEIGMEQLPEKARLYTADGINVEYMNALMQDEEYQKMVEIETPVMFPAYITGFRSMNLNLKVEGKIKHRLVVTEWNHSIQSGEGCLLRELAVYLESILTHEQGKNQTDNLKQVFEKILTDRTADYMEISQSLSALGWGNVHRYLCLVLQITYLDQKNLTTKAICQYIKRQFPESTSFQYNGEIVTFFNLTKLKLDGEQVSGKLTYFIRDSYLKAGYSRTVEGHMNLRRQYIQARTALDVGSRKRPYIWIHHFNQVVLPYILEQCTRKLPGQMLCHENLIELQKTDEVHGTEYMETLQAYLDENMNATLAARRLFIHRSTFLYRLEKIKSILQSELENPDEVFYLNLSFRLLEQEKQIEGNGK